MGKTKFCLSSRRERRARGCAKFAMRFPARPAGRDSDSAVTHAPLSFILSVMFKSAAAKLAHNSTMPALAGNKALRPLQDLITAEKAIITS